MGVEMDISKLLSVGVENLDLSKMSSVSKRDMYRAAKELRRRYLEERYRYFEAQCPPANDQLGFLNSSAKYRVAFGGNRSGKTEVGAIDTLRISMGDHTGLCYKDGVLMTRSEKHPPPVYGRSLSPGWEDGVRIILKKYQSLVPRSALAGGSWDTAWKEGKRTLYFNNGSQIKFFTYDQEVNKMGGDDVDWFWFDEHAPESVFDEHIMRILDRDGYGIFTMTPEQGITWEEDRLYLRSEVDSDVGVWFFSTLVNPHLSVHAREKIELEITDERLRDAKLFGKFVSLQGVVYTQWDSGVHVIPDIMPARHWHQQFVIDPHVRKPSVMIWTAWDPDGDVLHIVDEAEFGPEEGGVEQMAAMIRVKSGAYSVDDWIIDEAHAGSSQKKMDGGESIMHQLRRYGVPVRGTNVASDKSLKPGINKVREMLTPNPITKEVRLKVNRKCSRVAYQMSRWSYKRKTKADDEGLRENLQERFKDFPDCVRYAVMAGPYNFNRVFESPLNGKW